MIGGLAGAVVAAPPVQVPVVRYIMDHAYHRMVLHAPAGRADLLLRVEMAASLVRIGQPKFDEVHVFSLQVIRWPIAAGGVRWVQLSCESVLLYWLTCTSSLRCRPETFPSWPTR